jgi:hypothetical protein
MFPPFLLRFSALAVVKRYISIGMSQTADSNQVHRFFLRLQAVYGFTR